MTDSGNPNIAWLLATHQHPFDPAKLDHPFGLGCFLGCSLVSWGQLIPISKAIFKRLLEIEQDQKIVKVNMDWLSTLESWGVDVNPLKKYNEQSNKC